MFIHTCFRLSHDKPAISELQAKPPLNLRAKLPYAVKDETTLASASPHASNWMKKTGNMDTQFSITQSAATRITTLMASEDASYFRVRVDGGGCSGFQYQFDFDDTKQADDMEISAFGVRVLIDEMSLPFLENAQLDYVEELIGSFFKVENPNATASCGCGTSFSI